MKNVRRRVPKKQKAFEASSTPLPYDKTLSQHDPKRVPSNVSSNLLDLVAVTEPST
jgi:hypothetical protein